MKEVEMLARMTDGTKRLPTGVNWVTFLFAQVQPALHSKYYYTSARSKLCISSVSFTNLQ